MREIKFRGKASLYNIWVYGCYCATKINTFIIDENGELFPIYKDTVGQYTGLKDKNGVEIYEGDIVKSPFRSIINGVKTYIISYCKFGFMLQEYNLETKQHGDYECFIGDLLGKLEVIGNIYDKEDI